MHLSGNFLTSSIATGIFALASSWLFGVHIQHTLWLLFLTIIVLVLVLTIAIASHVLFCTKHHSRRLSSSPMALARFMAAWPFGANLQTLSENRLPVVFGRSVDIALRELLDLIIRDLVMVWLKDLVLDSPTLHQQIKEDLWFALGRLQERLSNVDLTKLIAMDMVTAITQHFENIRIAQSGNGSSRQFALAHHLASPEKELNYLRKISELLVVSLLPRPTFAHAVNRDLLVEILVCKVLWPFVELLTDPDYINQKLLQQIERVEQSAQIRKSLELKGTGQYGHASSFNEFIQLIKNCDDPEILKHFRYTIMTEIMQVTTLQNLKKSKNQEDARKLNKYLGQLSYAQVQSDVRLSDLGCEGFTAINQQTPALQIPLTTILESPEGRRHLGDFLEITSQEALLAFWIQVETLKDSDRKKWHDIGADIYYTFIHPNNSPISVDKSVRRRIETFLLGDSGPEVFLEVQTSVLESLQKLYPAFLTTDYYLAYLRDMEKVKHDGEREEMSAEALEIESERPKNQNRLNKLQEKLENKMQALNALRTTLKPESKVLSGLEKELANLEGEKRQLEAHISRTEAWGEHLGKWRAVVQAIELPDEKEPPQFVLVVHVLEDDADEDAVSTGWVVLRKLPEFYDLHRMLIPLWPGVKTLELPPLSPKFVFRKQDKSTMEKAKMQIQKYLESILQEEQVNASEAVYSFLCPSSDHLKANQTELSPKKTRFSLSTLFKSSGTVNSSSSMSSQASEMYEEEDLLSSGSMESKDAVAEPLYALIGEVFDLKGVFRWLRRTLITFVQITYGRTISRQLGDSVAWITSETMVLYYIQLFTQSWWPDGCLTQPGPSRSPEEKAATRIETKNRLRNNTPEVLNNLVGLQNARRGAVKVFEALQDVRLNKNLFYDIFELIIYELFPEIRSSRHK